MSGTCIRWRAFATGGQRRASGTRAACNVADMSQPDLDQVLEALAAQLAGDPPRTEDGEGARLVALLPCEPAIGEVAVACWQSGDGSEAVELVRLTHRRAGGGPGRAARVANLLAMVETLEELASFELAGTLADELDAWAATHLDDAPLPAQRARSRRRGAAPAGRRSLPARAPAWRGPASSMRSGARFAQLERDVGAARAGGGAVERCPPRCERGNERGTLSTVQELWRLLGTARGGPLRRAGERGAARGTRGGNGDGLGDRRGHAHECWDGT